MAMDEYYEEIWLRRAKERSEALNISLQEYLLMRVLIELEEVKTHLPDTNKFRLD